MRKINLLFLLLFCISGLFAQNKDSEITIGVNHTIKSSVLNQDRIIQIHTPEFIIVGINTSYPQHFRNFSNNAENS